MPSEELKRLLDLRNQVFGSGEDNDVFQSSVEAPETLPDFAGRTESGVLRIDITEDASDRPVEIPPDRQEEITNQIGRAIDLYRKAVPEIAPVGQDATGRFNAFNSGISQSMLGDVQRLTPFGQPRGTEYADMSRAERVAYQIGRSVGDNSLFLLVPSAMLPSAARVPVQVGREMTFARQAVDPIIQSYRTSPRAFGAAELSSIAGAAQARGIAETYFPGDQIVGAGAEMAGSMFNPIGTTYRAGRSALAPVHQFVLRNISPAARQREAASIVQGIARGFGENPEQVSAWVREAADIPGLPGQIVESRTLQAIHKNIASKNTDFRNMTYAEFQLANRHIEDTINSLFRQGSPEAIAAATRMRQQHLQQLLVDDLSATAHELNNAMSVIARDRSIADSQVRQAEMSQRVVEHLTTAMQRARDVQDQLYPEALRSLRVDMSELGVDDAYPSVMRIVQNISDRSIPGEDYLQTLRAVYGSRIGNALDRMMSIETPQPLELYNLAQIAGARAAAARNSGNYAEAQPLEELRRAIISDIDLIQDPLLATAREYTAAFHRVYDNTYVSRALSPRADSETTSPTVGMLGRAIAPGGVTARDRFRELERASAFASSSGRTPEDMDIMSFNIRNAQEEFLFANAHQFIVDGQISERSLRNFVNRQAALLEDFPAVREALESVTTANRMVDNMIRQNDLINTQEINLDIFNRILSAGIERSTTDLSSEVGRILTQNPRNGIRQLAELVNDPRFIKDNSERIAARRGMTLAIYENVAQSATRADGTLDWRRMDDIINQPLREGEPSILQLLRDNDVITRSEYEMATRLFQRGAQISRSAQSPYEVDSLVGEFDMMSQLIARASGSMIATRFLRMFRSSGEAGPSLIVAHAGSKAAQKFLGLNPNGKVMQIIMQAQTDPQLYQQLLTSNVGMTPAEHKLLVRRMNAVLYGAGLTADVKDEDLDFYNVPNIRNPSFRLGYDD